MTNFFVTEAVIAVGQRAEAAAAKAREEAQRHAAWRKDTSALPGP